MKAAAVIVIVACLIAAAWSLWELKCMAAPSIWAAIERRRRAKRMAMIARRRGNGLGWGWERFQNAKHFERTGRSWDA